MALIQGSDVVLEAEAVEETSAGDVPGARAPTDKLREHNAKVEAAAGVGETLPF